MTDKDNGVSAKADRATAAEPVVSALRDGIANALGYFDASNQTEPAHNPCHDARCPACGRVNGKDILARSIMLQGGKRSYFFAYHSACKGHPAIDNFEHTAISEIELWEAAQ